MATPSPSDPPEPTDEELAVLARRDPEAFGLLYDRYADRVYRYCWRRLGTREDAEDAAQFVFTKALAMLPRFRAASFRSWLFSIGHNVLVDHYRAAHVDAPLPSAESLTDPGPTPEEAMLAAETAHSVHALLYRFPPHEREVVELRLAGLADKEIAETLGLGYGYVRVLQHRAANRLRGLVVREAEGVRHV